MIVGIGIDIAEISRLRRMLDRRPTLLAQVFTPDEQQVFRAQPNTLEHFAAAFALKEAAFKALGQSWLESSLFWSDIELLSPFSVDSPRVRLSQGARARCDALGGTRLKAEVVCHQELLIASLWIFSGDDAPGVALGEPQS